MVFPVEFKNMPLERPPSVECPINPKNSFMTALSNFCVGNSKRLRMQHSSNGDAHMPMWTATCTIDGQEYGKACAFNKKSAEKDAANQTLQMLQKDGNSLYESRNYYPMFKDYLVEHQLENRVEFRSNREGPDHSSTWRCIVSLDGIDLATATGVTKKAAIEEASVNAATSWP